MIIVDTENLNKYVDSLCNLEAPIVERVDSLFCLTAFEEIGAVDGMIKAFHVEKKSELLMHEICYALGQMDKTPDHVAKITSFLEMLLETEQPQIVIHEAVEALGNLGNYNSLELLDRLQKGDSPYTEMVRETIELAQDLIKWNQATEKGKSEGLDLTKLKAKTNDPAPPFNFKTESKYRDVSYLTELLLDPKESLFNRYRAMFTLRELNTVESCVAICQSLKLEHFSTCSALLKHEVAFVLAQMEDVFHAAVPFLLEACTNKNEASIVKHEGLVAIGEMIDDEKIIDHLLEHEDPIVSESCAVAINNIRNRLAEQAEWEAKQKLQQESNE